MFLSGHNGYRVFDDYVGNLINGKSLLILGSAPSVLEMKEKEMESYDLIARVNNFWPFNKCVRSDIWYTMAGGSIVRTNGELKNCGCKLCFLKNPFAKIIGNGKLDSMDVRKTYDLWRRRWFELPWYIQKKEHWIWLNKQIGQIVTTGVSAIVDLYRFGPSCLHIAGFDFFSSLKHNNGVQLHLKPWPRHHDFRAEMLFCRRFVLQNKNITVDETIRKIFEHPEKFPKIGNKPEKK